MKWIVEFVSALSYCWRLQLHLECKNMAPSVISQGATKGKL